MNAKTYNRINRLLALVSKVTAELEKAEALIKTRQLNAASSLLPRHAQLSLKAAAAETELRTLSDANYEELFPESSKRSHKTPFGALAYHKSTSLEFDDEEKTVLMIEAECEAEAQRERKEGEQPLFTADQLIRIRCTPNLEAMESLDDDTLTRFGVRRIHKDKFTVKPFAMQTDKLGKSAEKAEAQ